MTRRKRIVFVLILVGVLFVAAPLVYALTARVPDEPFYGRDHSYRAPGRFVAKTFIERLYGLTKKELSMFDDSSTIVYLEIPTSHLTQYGGSDLPDPPFRFETFRILIFFDKDYEAIRPTTIWNYVRNLTTYPHMEYDAQLEFYKTYEEMRRVYYTNFDPRTLGEVSGNEIILPCSRRDSSPTKSSCSLTVLFDGMAVDLRIDESNLHAVSAYDAAIRAMILDWRVPDDKAN